MINLLRILKFGVKNFFRNIWLSTAATSIMILTIFTVSVLVMLNLVGAMAVETVKEKVDISIYLQPDATDSQINQVKNKLLSLPEVKSIDYTSKDEALKEFQREHKENDLILSSILELDENPLQPTLTVKARYPEDYAVIADIINVDEYKTIISKIDFDDNKEVINRLTDLTGTLRRVGIGLSAIFGLVVVLVVYNTIRLTIYTQKYEIRIMKLVGATNNFVRLPFIVEGIIYGLVGSIGAFAILYPLVEYFSPFVSNFLGEQSVDMLAYFSEHIAVIFLMEIAAGVLLGVVSSLLAVRRYVKSI
ncbi:MAG: ABC transporter permease [Parcubacteria group bacterium]|nr:ABC transporter permease [Parcubacteria group bacterium]